MTPRIRQVLVHDRSVDPTQAEVWVSVVPDRDESGLEVRGRLMGPRCLHARTVEVAYPLRPLSRAAEGMPALTRRVIVPEASPWEPARPYLYEGPIELWQDGQRCDQVWLRHGLRSLTVGKRGVVLNGKPLALKGRAQETLTEAAAEDLRGRGVNLLLIPAEAGAEVWERADRQGFLVLGRLAADAANRVELAARAAHACFLGWLLKGEVPGPFPAGARVGLELTAVPAAPLPEGVSFVACAAGTEAVRTWAAAQGKPVLLLDGTGPAEEHEGLMGHVEGGTWNGQV